LNDKSATLHQAQLATMKKAEATYKAAALDADACNEAFLAGKADADMKPKELTRLSQKYQQAVGECEWARIDDSYALQRNVTKR
jgi:hypothetical protein